MREIIIIIFTALFALVGIVWAAAHFEEAQWGASGMPYKWGGTIQGCVVQREDKRWVPAFSFREIDK